MQFIITVNQNATQTEQPISYICEGYHGNYTQSPNQRYKKTSINNVNKYLKYLLQL